MDNMKELLHKQNERILVLQMLVEALVDELIETKKIKESKLDERFSAKMEWAQSELDKAKEEASIDFLKSQIFSNQIGEA
jgi:polyhydroxyalkanoate synthesis regulator phasin